MPPKILYIINVDWYFLLHWVDRAEAVRAQGYEVHIATKITKETNREQLVALGFVVHNIDFVRKSLNPFNELRSLYQLYPLVKNLQPRLLHAITIRSIILATLSSLRFKMPAVFSFVGLGDAFTAKGLYRAFLTKVLKVFIFTCLRSSKFALLFENRHDTDIILDMLSKKAECHSVLISGAGVDLKRFVYSPLPNDQPFQVLFAARLLKSKGLDKLIQACRSLRSEGVDVVVNVAGILDDDSRDAVSADQIAEWKALPFVVWHGNVSDIESLINITHIVCLPTSYGEGIPRILIEAGACGRPIITTRVSGCAEFVTDGVDGLLVDANDDSQLLNALKRLVGSPEIMTSMAQSAFEKVCTRYSADIVIRETLDVYDQMSGALGSNDLRSESTVPVKVLQMYRTYFPDTQGGAEEVIRQIAINSAEIGIETRIIVPSSNIKKAKKIYVDGIVVYQVPELIEIASCNIYKSGFDVLKELVLWADIIHYHYPWPFQDVLHFALIKKYQKKTVVTYHSDVIRQLTLLKLYQPLQSAFLDDVDVVVATSPAYLDSSLVLQKYRSKVEVIPLGLSSYTLPDQPSKAAVDQWREKLGEGFFFFVGVLRYYKGLDVLISAAVLSGLKVVIAGAGFEWENLQQQKNLLGAESVHLLGRISDEDKCALINLSKAVILPSYVRSEAFGVSLLEGMFYSKPLITAELDTGVNFVNKDGVTGIKVDAQSARGLAHAMLKLDKDPELARTMGQAARQRYERLFTGRTLGESYANLYKRLVVKK
jgi:rhamnosyl/mannosyltransferase